MPNANAAMIVSRSRVEKKKAVIIRRYLCLSRCRLRRDYFAAISVAIITSMMLLYRALTPLSVDH